VAYFAREESIGSVGGAIWSFSLAYCSKAAALEDQGTPDRRTQNAPAPSLASFGFGLLGGLGCYGLIDF